MASVSQGVDDEHDAHDEPRAGDGWRDGGPPCGADLPRKRVLLKEAARLLSNGFCALRLRTLIEW